MLITKDDNQLIRLLSRLEKDPVRNSSIIGFMKDYPPLLVLSVGETVLIKGKSDREWVYISGGNEAELKILLLQLQQNDLCFASIEDWMIPVVTQNKEPEWKLEALRYYLPESVTLPPNKIKIDTLNENYADFIVANSNYKEYIEPEYIAERIRKSFSAGVFENGKLAGWALTHDDGAIGVLHVPDEFRNKGYAKEIVIHLAGKVREAGAIPIAQIEKKNTTALNLFTKLGFVKYRKVVWLKLKE